MNPYQMAKQIRKELTTVAWAEGSADVVFGTRGVRIISGEPTDEQIPAVFPFCLVSMGAGTADVDHPELVLQTFRIMACVMVKGDPMGEHAVLGGTITEQGKSAGRGILEIMERVYAAVGDLTGIDGATIQLSQTSLDVPRALGRMGGHVVVGDVKAQAVCTSSLYYDPPQILANSVNTWTWEGTHCANRFDFKQFRLGYIAGSVPAQNPDSVTVVYTGTDESTTHTPVAGQAYSIFADYNPRDTTGSVIATSKGNLVGAYLTT
jgi:hypothetical protein